MNIDIKRARVRNYVLESKDDIPNGPTAFDVLVAKLKLKESDWHKSERLRKWVSANRNSRYVPEELLGVWNMRLRADKL
jgi:hypothetical protein